MNKIAFLSGKGGSGKTSISLSIASILSSFGVSVLLIDCDLITNGATYFFEDNLTGSDVTSCVDLLVGTDCFHPMVVNKYFHFIPAITSVRAKRRQEIYDYSKFVDYINFNTNEYDIVLFDCAAGYSEISDCICQQTESNVFVMEADAISSASLRSLFLKIGNKIKKAKNYQIFNKVTKEEYSIYSKISGGTVFLNISPIRFDWRIRKAFALAEMPEIKSLGAEYIIQMLDLCKIIVSDSSVKSRISDIEDTVCLEYREIQAHYSKRAEKSKERGKRWKLAGVLLLMGVCLFMGLVISKDVEMPSSDVSSIVIVFMTMTSVLFGLLGVLYGSNSTHSSDETDELVQQDFRLSLQSLQKECIKNDVPKKTK